MQWKGCIVWSQTKNKNNTQQKREKGEEREKGWVLWCWMGVFQVTSFILEF